jgi:hypothetical protein
MWLDNIQIVAPFQAIGFFGIGNAHRITIYISNLRINAGGAVGIDGKELSYQGLTAAFGEMSQANRFRDLFNHLLPFKWIRLFRVEKGLV